MDKDMMTKVNDLLKAKGLRELSLDEMDKVSGGSTKQAPSDYTPFGGMNATDAGIVLQSIIDTKGVDVAVSFANEFWGHSPDWAKFIYASRDKDPGDYACQMIAKKSWESGHGGSGF